MQLAEVEVDLVLYERLRGEKLLRQILFRTGHSLDRSVLEGAVFLSERLLGNQVSEKRVFHRVGTVREVAETEGHVEDVTFGSLRDESLPVRGAPVVVHEALSLWLAGVESQV